MELLVLLLCFIICNKYFENTKITMLGKIPLDLSSWFLCNKTKFIKKINFLINNNNNNNKFRIDKDAYGHAWVKSSNLYETCVDFLVNCTLGF